MKTTLNFLIPVATVILIVGLCVFLWRFVKSDALVGEITGSYVTVPSVVNSNVSLDDLARCNRELASRFPDYHVLLTCNGESDLCLVIMHERHVVIAQRERSAMSDIVFDWMYKQAEKSSL